MKKSVLRQIIQEEILKLEAPFTKTSLRKDANLARDLEKDKKSITSFLKNNYQTLMTLCNDKKKLIEFIKKGTKRLHVSDQYLNKMISIIKKNNATQNQMYISNTILKGKGLSTMRI